MDQLLYGTARPRREHRNARGREEKASSIMKSGLMNRIDAGHVEGTCAMDTYTWGGRRF